MVESVNKILKQVLQRIEPEGMKEIKDSLAEFEKKLKNGLKKQKINADVFVGGSFAKGTVIKKSRYDVDIFVRFDKQYRGKDISEITERILKKISGKFKKIHGSRDYFEISESPLFYFELIPVIRVSNPKESENITDLSYSHVNYIKRKVKERAKNSLIDDIKIAKAFCYANRCYGAESYINGFSGYSLELLIVYYKSFLRFIKEMTNVKAETKNGDKDEKKLVIDIEKQYKNKQDILMDMNSSKLQSPIILVDPTFRERNALAALSSETFLGFQKACREFLRNPSLKMFEKKKTDLERVREDAKKRGFEFASVEISTDRQEGDIAGSKLLKFYNHLIGEVEIFFEMKNKGFSYDEKKSAKIFFVVKRKKEIISSGPLIKDKKNTDNFKREHKSTFVKNGRIYARKKINFNIKEFIKKWKDKNSKKMDDMSITNLKIVG
jgi:tRNA nucleotidyltransferase (CCA-adding enzyme)